MKTIANIFDRLQLKSNPPEKKKLNYTEYGIFGDEMFFSKIFT